MVLQPIVIILEILISIVHFLGFNGFVRVGQLFGEGRGFAGFLALVVSIIFMSIALFSSFIYIRIAR